MYGICIDIPRVYIISEWIEGMNLEQYLKQNGPQLEVSLFRFQNYHITLIPIIDITLF